MSNVSRNGSGYFDPTASDAIGKTDSELKRFRKLINAIFTICELSGFHVEERIVLRDKKTGKVWR